MTCLTGFAGGPVTCYAADPAAARLTAAVRRTGLVVCALGLLLGRFARTGEPVFAYLAVLVAAALLVGDLIKSCPARSPGPGPRPSRWAITEGELALATCLLAPLTGGYLPVIGTVAALLVLSELAAACRAWRRTVRAPRPGVLVRDPHELLAGTSRS